MIFAVIYLKRGQINDSLEHLEKKILKCNFIISGLNILLIHSLILPS